MFGYFRFNQLFASPKLKNIYKNYYCGTCFALEYNYGELTRCILSYDVVILAILAQLYDSPNQEPLNCFFNKNSKKQFIEDQRWVKIAATNVLLMNSKFDDDINDEKSLKAKAATMIFYNIINKAKKQFPELSAIIKTGYQNMYELEQSNAAVLQICDCFADMMENIVVNEFQLNGNKVKFVRAISRWLYFIDQLDDYDDDIQKNKYNPLIIEGVSKSEYINKNNGSLLKILSDLFKDFDSIKKNFDMTCYEECLLYAVLNESIPSVTSLILSEKGLPKLLHTSKGMEWRDSDK